MGRWTKVFVALSLAVGGLLFFVTPPAYADSCGPQLQYNIRTEWGLSDDVSGSGVIYARCYNTSTGNYYVDVRQYVAWYNLNETADCSGVFRFEGMRYNFNFWESQGSRDYNPAGGTLPCVSSGTYTRYVNVSGLVPNLRYAYAPRWSNDLEMMWDSAPNDSKHHEGTFPY